MKNLVIFGCGDFLRWQLPSLKTSTEIRVSGCYDPDTERARQQAEELGAEVITDPDAVFADPKVDAVALFVPPWIRKDLFLKAAAAGKHVMATKPLGSTPAECEAMRDAAESTGIRAAVIYGRTGDAFTETVKSLLDAGTYGRLALYRQDWIHAYPQWNKWATDPEKNGGPFMDAMIHNLNAAAYLMGRPIEHTSFFSQNLAHPEIACADTECMVVNFEGGMAHLFITWAADLATHSTKGNDREHIDLFYLVTDKGHRLTQESVDGKTVIRISREGENIDLPCEQAGKGFYDGFAAHIDGAPLPRTLVSLEDATRDLRLVRQK